jgi:hypothetical protein
MAGEPSSHREDLDRQLDACRFGEDSARVDLGPALGVLAWAQCRVKAYSDSPSTEAMKARR